MVPDDHGKKLNAKLMKASLLASILIPTLIMAMPHTAHGATSPIAAFSWAPCEACAVVGNLFFFSAGASIATSGSIVLYMWNFGDGSPLVQTTNPIVNYDYLSGCLSPCTVTLTVQDSNGLTDTIKHQILFDTVPVIEFQPVNATVGLPVTFNGTASIAYSPTNPILGYDWSFGDGTNATGKIVTHIYTATGPYRIILTLVTAEGDPSASSTIKVGTPILVTLLKTTFSGVNITASVSLAIDTAMKTLVGSVSVTAVNATTGAVIFSKTFNINVTFSSTMSIKFELKVPVTAIALGIDCSTNSTTATTSCIVTRNTDIDNDGTVGFIDVSAVAYAFGSTVGSPKYSPALDLNADGIISFIDVSIVAYYYRATVLS
jgi:PKD repeat protein